ncbi:hypothetical protein CC79DRAFT_216700 [Sarocladium strictum]
MSEGAEATGGDATVTFKVKTSADGNHTITMAETATVFDLKTKLAGEDFENIPVERQRLIYSGRVMKNDDTLATYKIKPNNTIHMVKSAASNPGQPASSSAQTAPQAVPTNMASGTANNPLAGLTGARYAGQGLQMPDMDMFGPDGGVRMGPGMDEEALARMMADPNAQQALNEVLNNPDVVNHLIESNPMLRNVPNAREIIQSPFMRQMMTNPQMMTQMMRMRRGMAGGGAGAFPAPGATDNAPADGSGATGENAAGNPNAQANPFMNPFMMMPGMGGLGGADGGQGGQDGLMNMLQQMQAAQGQGFGGQRAATGDAGTGTTPSTGAAAGTGTTGQGDAQNQPPANPFAALFGAPGAGAGGAGAGANPFGMTPEMMQSMMQMMGGGGGAPTGPPDTRPPEERFAEQLRQLNDMGFFDFDRNVAALRRSGGSVQGAIEHLLNATD